MDDQAPNLRRLMNVGLELLAELDPDTVLERVLDEARSETGAKYAALGVLNEERTELSRFLTRGIAPHEQRAIGDLPRGRGVLGVLIDDPRPLRLHDVGTHPRSFGFPAGHPTMESFLGVPIVVRGQAWGNLYLTEKDGGGDFTDTDQEAVVILAQFAATAIENARLYQTAERGRQALAQAVRGLEAARDIADTIGAEPDLSRVLELIAKRGRALVAAGSVLIMLREGDDLVVAASAGTARATETRRINRSASASGRALSTGRSARIGDGAPELTAIAADCGLPDAHAALLVPMSYRGSELGVVVAFDRGAEQAQFTATDEDLLRTFAASAANAVAVSRSVEADRLRSAIAAAEDERRRWARELHDQTLQALGAVRVLLATAGRTSDVAELHAAVGQAVTDIDGEIANLRSIISDLRPSLLDDLGLTAALESLAERRRRDGLPVSLELRLPERDREPGAIPPELETTVYRLVQESLTNVVKHAKASEVRVGVALADGALEIEVADDGVGFDESAPTIGFGLAGLRERVYLAGGTLAIESSDRGTVVHAHLPVAAAAQLRASAVQQTTI